MTLNMLCLNMIWYWILVYHCSPFHLVWTYLYKHHVMILFAVRHNTVSYKQNNIFFFSFALSLLPFNCLLINIFCKISGIETGIFYKLMPGLLVQVISIHGIGCAVQTCHCLTQGRTSTTSVISVLRNNREFKYIFVSSNKMIMTRVKIR